MSDLSIVEVTLKSCPFCGGPATVIVTDCRPCNVEGWTDAYSVWCNASVLCGGRKSKLYNDRDNAIAAWNTRASTASEAERVREAAAALVAKLDECDPHLTSMFSFALAHDHLYSGPTYGEELEALRAALKGAQ